MSGHDEITEKMMDDFETKLSEQSGKISQVMTAIAQQDRGNPYPESVQIQIADLLAFIAEPPIPA